MRLLNETFNDELNFNPFIDELDRFDEFDLEMISRDYDKNMELNYDMKILDEKK